MSKEDNYMDRENMSGGQTLLFKLKSKPEVTLGILSFATVIGIGIYGYKKRKVNTSLYVVQFRVYAQTAALGCMGAGLIYHMYQRYTNSAKKS